MTAKTFIILAALAIAAFIVGVGRYNTDYPNSHRSVALKDTARV